MFLTNPVNHRFNGAIEDFDNDDQHHGANHEDAGDHIDIQPARDNNSGQRSQCFLPKGGFMLPGGAQSLPGVACGFYYSDKSGGIICHDVGTLSFN